MPELKNNTKPEYEMNHHVIEGVEQLKYFDRLNRAVAR